MHKSMFLQDPPSLLSNMKKFSPLPFKFDIKALNVIFIYGPTI